MDSKVILYVIGGAVAVYLLGRMSKPEKDENAAFSEHLNKVNNHYKETGEPITYSATEFKEFGSQIENALRGISGFKNKTDKIKNVIDLMVTNRDLVSLNYYFGVRDGETLKQWLYSDFCLSYINEYILTRNFEYQF